MSPRARSSGREDSSSRPTSAFVGIENIPRAMCTLTPLPSSGVAVVGDTTMTSAPLEASSYARGIVSGRDTASNTKGKPTSVFGRMVRASAHSAACARVRSRTCVAPRDARYAACWGDAVVTIGVKPERRRNWIAVADPASRNQHICHLDQKQVRRTHRTVQGMTIRLVPAQVGLHTFHARPQPKVRRSEDPKRSDLDCKVRGRQKGACTASSPPHRATCCLGSGESGESVDVGR